MAPLNTKAIELLKHQQPLQQLSNAGQELLNHGYYEQASQHFSAVIKQDPSSFAAHLGKGICHNQLKQFSQAVDSCDQAVNIALWQYVDATINKAIALSELPLRGKEAIALMDMVLTLQGQSNGQAFLIKGIAKLQYDDFSGALQDFKSALELNSDEMTTRYSKAFAHLASGDYAQGFIDREFSRIKPIFNLTSEQGREWQGEPLTDKTLLVLCEYGLGDMLMYGRYLLMLGASEIHCMIDSRLRPLFARSFPHIKFFDEPERIGTGLHINRSTWPRSDCWVRLTSLAYLLETSLNTVPPPMPVRYDSYDTQVWRQVIPPFTSGTKVGLCWSGNPIGTYAEHRAVPFDDILRLTNIKSPVRFYSLQLATPENKHVQALDHYLSDFYQTAHAIAALDLVITADTSVAHLAGTIGIPTWLLLPQFGAAWMWMRGQKLKISCPWYPSIKSYRQKTVGDWTSVLDKVKIDLKRFCERIPEFASSS